MTNNSVPTLEKPVVKYRGKTSSEEYNKMTEELYLDLTHLFDMTNENAQKAEEVIKQLTLENSHLRAKAKELKNKLKEIENMLTEYQAESNTYTSEQYTEAMVIDDEAVENNRALIDKHHRVATLPISGQGISKTHIWDSFKDKTFIPDELKISFDKPINNYPVGVNAEETSPKNAFDGQDETVWAREISFLADDPTGEIETQMYIDLPENIINNRKFNTIMVHPYPTNGVEIVKIEYSTSATSAPDNSDWSLIPGWKKDENGNPLPIKNAGPIKFCFEDISTNKIRIKLRQDHAVQTNEYKTFTLGLKQFDILYNNYTVESASLMVPFELVSDGTLFTLEEVNPELDNKEAMSDNYEPCTFEIYSEDEWGDLQYLDNKAPIENIDSQKIWIRVTLHADKNKESTPALSSLKIMYKTI